jgi:hypothetical protein
MLPPNATVREACERMRRRWFSKMPWPGNDLLNPSRELCGGVELVVMLAQRKDRHLVEIFGGLMVAELALDAAGWLT